MTVLPLSRSAAPCVLRKIRINIIISREKSVHTRISSATSEILPDNSIGLHAPKVTCRQLLIKLWIKNCCLCQIGMKPFLDPTALILTIVTRETARDTVTYIGPWPQVCVLNVNNRTPFNFYAGTFSFSKRTPFEMESNV